MQKHPDYPGLLAISDVLQDFEVANNAYRLEFKDLKKVPCPYISYINLNGGEFVLITKRDDEHFYVKSDKWNNRKFTVTEFGQIFDGVILTTEKNIDAKLGSSFNFRAHSFQKVLFITGLVLILFAGLFLSNYFNFLNWNLFLLTIIKSAGLITSILLLVQSIDNNNPLVQKLCSTGGNKTNCNAILLSKAAKLSSWLSWSEIGFFYFAGTWLLLLFGIGQHFCWNALIILNLLGIPYTIYSIYYQAFVAKQWCTLCCAVQVVLWLEFAVFVMSFNKSFLPAQAHAAIPLLFICLTLPILLWATLRNILFKLKQINPLKLQLSQFK